MQKYIEVDALKRTINDNDYPLRDSFNSFDRGMFTSGIMQAIDEQPAAYIRDNSLGSWSNNYCTRCGKRALLSFQINQLTLEREYYFVHSPFCAYCGAKMLEVEVEE